MAIRSDGAITQHLQLGGISTDARTRITNHTLEMLRKNVRKFDLEDCLDG